MKLKKKEANNEVVDVFTKFLNHHNHRKTPERFSILNEIYSIFNYFVLFSTIKTNDFRQCIAIEYRIIIFHESELKSATFLKTGCTVLPSK